MGSLRGRLEAQSHALGIASSTTFAGAVSDEDLLSAYGSADLFVMPGTAELQSLATLEAMAAGLPVVAANAMALPHLVDDTNGSLYTPGDVTGLTHAMLTILENPLLRAGLGRSSRRIAEQHSLTATLTAFEDYYTQLVAARRPTRVEVTPALAMAS